MKKLVSILFLLAVLLVGVMPAEAQAQQAVSAPENSRSNAVIVVGNSSLRSAKPQSFVALGESNLQVVRQSSIGTLVSAQGVSQETLISQLQKQGIKAYPNKLITKPPFKRGAKGEILGAEVKNTNYRTPRQGLSSWWFAMGGFNTQPNPQQVRNRKVTVCWVDSAMRLDDEYRNLISSTKGYNYWAFQDNTSSSSEWGEGIHGQATSRLFLQALGGLSSKVEVIPYVVLSDFWGGDSFSLASSLRDCADEGGQVANLSLGWYAGFQDEMVVDAIKYAKSKGVALVIAAGNEGGFVSFPANFADIISGGVDQLGRRFSFSNRPTPGTTERMRYLSAPGEATVSVPTWYDSSGEETMQGTSFSAPLNTAQVVRRMLTSNDTSAQAVRFVLGSVRSVGVNSDYGLGIPNTNPTRPSPIMNSVSLSRYRIGTGGGNIVVTAKLLGATAASASITLFNGATRTVKLTQSRNTDWVSAPIQVDANVSQPLLRYVKIRADGPSGSYEASEMFLQEGRNNISSPSINVSPSNPNSGDAINISFNWGGVYDTWRVTVYDSHFPPNLVSDTYLKKGEVFSSTLVPVGDNLLIVKWYHAGIRYGYEIRDLVVSGTTSPSNGVIETPLAGPNEVTTNGVIKIFNDCWGTCEVMWDISLNGSQFATVADDSSLELKGLGFMIGSNIVQPFKVGDKVTIAARWGENDDLKAGKPLVITIK